MISVERLPWPGLSSAQKKSTHCANEHVIFCLEISLAGLGEDLAHFRH